jgi:hypothetical protein
VPTVFDSCHGSKRGNHDEDSYNGKVICDAEGATRNAGESDKNIKANGNSDREGEGENHDSVCENEGDGDSNKDGPPACAFPRR